jgi:1-phosphatidylinositol-3-phosphate 5-kinase
MSAVLFHGRASMLSKIIGMFVITVTEKGKQTKNKVRQVAFLLLLLLLPPVACLAAAPAHVQLAHAPLSAPTLRQMILMENLFQGHASLSHMFDLKGKHDGDYTRLLTEFPQGLPVALSSEGFFRDAYHNDTTFLMLLDVVDYSIVLGVDDERGELVVGIIDYMRQFDIVKRFEGGAKAVLRGDPTVRNPHAYMARFVAAMNSCFVFVPDSD